MYHHCIDRLAKRGINITVGNGYGLTETSQSSSHHNVFALNKIVEQVVLYPFSLASGCCKIQEQSAFFSPTLKGG